MFYIFFDISYSNFFLNRHVAWKLVDIDCRKGHCQNYYLPLNLRAPPPRQGLSLSLSFRIALTLSISFSLSNSLFLSACDSASGPTG